MKNLLLITGGAKSGKSRLAEKLAEETSNSVAYLATMPHIKGDIELDEKVRHHRLCRPKHWLTYEVQSDLDRSIAQLEGVQACIIDCLSLFVANEMFAGADDVSNDGIVEKGRSMLLAMEARPEIKFLVVTNEVGWGIVPDNVLGRKYRDLLGQINQEFAALADTVWLCCAGLPLRLKPEI